MLLLNEFVENEKEILNKEILPQDLDLLLSSTADFAALILMLDNFKMR